MSMNNSTYGFSQIFLNVSLDTVVLIHANFWNLI